MKVSRKAHEKLLHEATLAEAESKERITMLWGNYKDGAILVDDVVGFEDLVKDLLIFRRGKNFVNFKWTVISNLITFRWCVNKPEVCGPVVLCLFISKNFLKNYLKNVKRGRNSANSSRLSPTVVKYGLCVDLPSSGGRKLPEMVVMLSRNFI